MSIAWRRGHPDPLRFPRHIVHSVLGTAFVVVPDLPRFTVGRVFTETSLEPVPFVLTVWIAGLYLVGVVTLRRRGDHWPVGRTISFVVVGMGLFLFATSSGLAAYDTTLLSVHMVQHMVLSMLVPLALALGAPVTLALRTLPARPRRGLLVVLHCRVAKVLVVPAADLHPVRRVAMGAVLLRLVRGLPALAVRARDDASPPGARRLALLLAARGHRPGAGARGVSRSGSC